MIYFLIQLQATPPIVEIQRLHHLHNDEEDDDPDYTLIMLYSVRKRKHFISSLNMH